MYEQQAALAHLLPALVRAYDELTPRHTFEAIIVDDGSTDRTFDIAWPWSERVGFAVKVIRLNPHEGVGGAIRQGMTFCLGTAVCTWDPEGARPFSDLAPMAELIEAGADVVTTPQPDTSRGERFISTDVTGVSGLHRAYRREIYERIVNTRDDDVAHAELLANALAAGLRVEEARELEPLASREEARPTWFTALRLRGGNR